MQTPNRNLFARLSSWISEHKLFSGLGTAVVIGLSGLAYSNFFRAEPREIKPPPSPQPKAIATAVAREPNDRNQTPVDKTPSPEKTDSTPRSEARLEDIEKKFLKMAGRPAEQEAVIEQSDGAPVRWTVTVIHAAQIGSDIHVYLKPRKPVDLISSVLFKNNRSRRVLELREGDTVTITGVLHANPQKDGFKVEASEFQLVLPDDTDR